MNAAHSNEMKDVPSFARGLFLGKLQTDQVFPYPDALNDEARETLSMMIDPTTKFFKEVNNPALNDETSSVPENVSQGMKELGLFGLQVPTDLQGAGLSNTAYARMVEIVGANDLGIGIYLGAHQSIGFKGILLVGNEKQRAKYLPLVATGEKIAAFCLTEPSSGSDANSIKTKAVLSSDGKHFILNGSKIWISNGGIAEVFTVFAQTEVEDKKNPGKKVEKVTAFIVERGFGGVTNGAPEKKMGIKCSNTTELYLENVKVPVENVLGEVGGGFKVAMSILNNGRFGMGAALTGTMKSVISVAANHAVNRKQFGKTITEFGLIKEKFAQMAIKTYAAESMAYMLSAVMDKGATDYQIEAAITKVFASEAAWYVCDEGIQVLGGQGFMRAMPLERVLRDLRIFRIFEGTNDILRLLIAGEGLKTAGSQLKEMRKDMSNPTKIVPALLSLIKRPDPISKAHPSLASTTSLIEKRTGDFGKIVKQILLKYGKNLPDEQLVMRRIADCVIDFYAMAAVTSRATRALETKSETAEHESQLCQAFCIEANQRIIKNLEALKGIDQTSDSHVKKIADSIFEKKEYFAEHPTKM